MFRCYSYTIIRGRINLCLLKLQLLKQSIKIHTVLATHRCILIDYFNNCNIRKHKLLGSLMMV